MKPKIIIIDTSVPLSRFLQHTHFFQMDGIEIGRDYLEDYLDSIIDQTIDAIYNPKEAVSQLWNYGRRLRESCEMCDQAEDGVLFQKGVIDLGIGILDVLQSVGAYKLDGKLGYYHSGRIGHADLILTRL